MDFTKEAGKFKLHPIQTANVSVSVVKLTDSCIMALEQLALDRPDGPKITMTLSKDKDKGTLSIPSSTCSPPKIFDFKIEGNCINGQDHLNLIKCTADNKLCRVMGPINNSKINIEAGEETFGNCATKMASENEGRNQTKLLKVIPSQLCRTEPSQRKRRKMTNQSSNKTKSALCPALNKISTTATATEFTSSGTGYLETCSFTDVKAAKIEVNRRTELPKSDSQGKVNKVSVGVSTTATATESASSGPGYLETCSFRDVKAPKKRISRCQQQQSGGGSGGTAERSAANPIIPFDQLVQQRLNKYSKITNDIQKAEYKAEFKQKYHKYKELYDFVIKLNPAQNFNQAKEHMEAINEYKLLHEEMICIKELIKEYQEFVDKYEDEESVDESENELCF